MLLVTGVNREFAHSFSLRAGTGHEVHALQLAAGLGDRGRKLAERLLAGVELNPDRDAVLRAYRTHAGVHPASLRRARYGCSAVARFVLMRRQS